MNNADDILDKALELAANSSWESVRLNDIAADLNISLYEIHQHYRQKDDLADAWFDRVDKAMFIEAAKAEFLELCGRERLNKVIMAWLKGLAPHRRASIDMLKYKLEFGHVHLQASGVLRISRTVQWMLEAVGSKTVNTARIAEEVGTSSVFLSTFVYWLTDHSEGYANTEKFLDSLLRKSEKLARTINPTSVITEPGSEHA